MRLHLTNAILLSTLCFQPLNAQPAPASALWPAAIVARAESDPKVFGPLRLGISETEVRDKLGAPSLISRRSMMMGSEEYTYTWDYGALGVTIVYAAFDESTAGTVMAIRAKAPCDWAAVGGLKVGMSIEKASQILKKKAGANVSPLGSVGSEMAGLFFELSDTAVAARLEMGVISVLYVGPNLP